MLPLVRAGALAGYKKLLTSYGVDPTVILQRMSLPTDYLDEPERLIPVETKIELFELAATLTKQPDFGLQLATHQDISMLGALGLLAQQCETVGEAVQTFAAHVSHHMQELETHLEFKGDIALLHLHHRLAKDARISRQHSDNAVINAYNILNMLCGGQLKVRSAYLVGEEPRSTEPYTRILHAPIAFGCERNTLVFDRSYLNLPIANANPAIRRLLQSHLQKTHPDDFVSQTRWVIANLLPRQTATLEEVANSLGIAPRTLQHKLSALSLSFQQLLDEVRVKQVCSYIKESDLSLTEISELVGYSQLSAMTRSFKRLMGVSPGAWRKAERHPSQSNIA